MFLEKSSSSKLNIEISESQITEKCLGAIKPKGINRIPVVIIDYGYICRKGGGGLSFDNNYIY